MSELITRTFAPELEIMPRAKGGDGRTVYGISVPYNRAVRIDAALVEEFAPGTFKHQFRAANRIKFSREHLTLGGTLLGNASLLRDDTAGLYGEYRVSKTQLGDDTLELIRDGALDELSVAFREQRNLRKPDGTVRRTRADLVEVAVVLEGAYGQMAAAAGVRSRQDGHGSGGCVECGCTCGGAELTRSVPNMDQARQILAGLPVLPV